MKRTLAVLVLFLIALSSCKKKCESCNENQDCNNGVCQCKQWYEGNNCQTAMSAKFNGTFVGFTYENGVNPIADTFAFNNLGLAYAALLTNEIRGSKRRAGANIFLQSSTAAVYKQIYAPVPQLMSSFVTCGTAAISSTGQNLTLSFSPVDNYTGIVDSSTLYTFIGTKQ